MRSPNVLKNALVSKEMVNLLERQELSLVGPGGLPMGSFDQPVYSEAQMRAATEALEAQVSQLREDIEAARRQAYQDGMAQGRELERTHLHEKAERLEQLAGEILAERGRILGGASRDVAVLAVRLAERFCRRAQEDDPNLVLRGVEEALSAFASGERVVVRVHPGDIDLVRGQRQELGRLLDEGSDLQLRADESLTPGDCVVETARLHIDGTVEGFLDRCTDALGHWAQREDLLIEEKDAENAA